jgi:hypothetical protein
MFEKYEDFSDWSNYNGLPAQWGKIRGFFKNDHIVMGYLPREKNTRIFRIGNIVMEKYKDFFRLVIL